MSVTHFIAYLLGIYPELTSKVTLFAIHKSSSQKPFSRISPETKLVDSGICLKDAEICVYQHSNVGDCQNEVLMLQAVAKCY